MSGDSVAYRGPWDCWGLIPPWPRMWPLFWPAALHGMSVIIQGEGLRYVTASVSQMIAGSCIIFTALLAVLIIKCRLNWLHITGTAPRWSFPPSTATPAYPHPSLVPCRNPALPPPRPIPIFGFSDSLIVLGRKRCCLLR